MSPNPDLQKATHVVCDYLADRVFRGWSLDELTYNYTADSYNAVFSNGAQKVSLRLLGEWIDTPASDSFSRRKMKRALKEAFRIQLDADDK